MTIIPETAMITEPDQHDNGNRQIQNHFQQERPFGFRSENPVQGKPHSGWRGSYGPNSTITFNDPDCFRVRT